MKKILVAIILFFIPSFVLADSINNVSAKIYIKEDGSASVTETWDVKADSGSEWYKALYNLGNMSVQNYHVYMDGKPLTQKIWNVNESLTEKRGFYGINYVDEGVELCFGKGDYNNHVFTLTYTLSNMVFNTNDNQVIYFTFLPKATLSSFNIEISSFYSFPDDLPVWGYGYDGFAYVKDGKIFMSDKNGLSNDYVTLLVQFPLETFNSQINSISGFNTFDDVLTKANEGASAGIEFNLQNILAIIGVILFFLCFEFPIIPFIIIVKLFISRKKADYGYLFNKKIENVPYFRDIPCNKDIYYANALIYLNDSSYKESNVLGAIILKWIKEDKVTFIHKEGSFNRQTSAIDLRKNVTFDMEEEKELYLMMLKASHDGILEIHEFERWCSINYSKFFALFSKIRNKKINELSLQGHVYPRQNRKECKQKMVMDDFIFEESTKLFGLKEFLKHFSNIKEKEAINVKIWDEYLMFAYLFGIADKVAKQFKNLYPEVISDAHFDYETFAYVDHISSRASSSASNAKRDASRYSAGGGGVSFRGGGGGSFGGGGSMGGR